uniref:CS domain-containing protein n=1 Tax=Pyrodinium bahamense TaxID=73915 RepID=A0A7S0F9K8_9DINO|mmetsp:Transcript_14336/g.39675  ORF Transcript_14336/g.39675 Transcript_14336/m.39675 type:complete len:273 (+) Transcript_14336:108-926(+)
MKTVTDMTHEQMLMATSALRAEARAAEMASGELPPKPPGSALTVGGALSEMVATMQSDKFWADLAVPLESAQAAIEAGTDAERERAVVVLKDLQDQLEELKKGKVTMFVKEKEVLSRIIALLSESAPAPVTLDTVLEGLQYERTSGHGSSAPISEKSRELAKKGAEVIKNFPMDPWLFKEVQNQVEVTVSIRVPPDTKKEDVKVSIQPLSLRVTVRGHERQPHVINGELSGPIDVDGSGWHLDGSGDNRNVVIDLEKQMGGITWHRLLKSDL